MPVHIFFSTEITERRVLKKMALGFHVAKLKLSQIIVPRGLLAQSVACVCHREHDRPVKAIPSLASCTISFSSISSRVLSLFSSFCIMLPTSTMAPLYTIKLPDSLVSALTRALGAGRRLRLPEREKSIRRLCHEGVLAILMTCIQWRQLTRKVFYLSFIHRLNRFVLPVVRQLSIVTRFSDHWFV